ncbi:hypothetical protein [Methylobacterium indicum]|uniref:Bacteriophage Mu GpT domain-containing protein n=1 Tax=Methylobacterium indicum TaxID=1775910 RepID=A0ABR5GZ31_9HYPH|nr:hypothetical protein [Methylobacterium indicum]KMO15769.1 hypothetical protein QR79_23825 [Methylobacterium indicum]KMO18045.1 hypothetical protein QR78_16170 [Methylobacterium indicum]
MPAYPDLVRQIQQGRSVKRAILARLDFASGTERYWLGFGDLATLDPFAANPSTANRIVWKGLGQLGTISDVDRALTTPTPTTLGLSGVDATLAARAMRANDEVKGRPARIFEQYFDAETSQVVDIPVILASGVMDRTQIQITGPTTCTISVQMTSLLFRRRRPAQAYLSDATQQMLHPGDNGARSIPLLTHKTANWPVY